MEKPEHPKGDIDGDGKITINDISQLIEKYLNPTDDPIESMYDIDGDGSVTVEDIAQLIEIYLNENNTTEE